MGRCNGGGGAKHGGGGYQDGTGQGKGTKTGKRGHTARAASTTPRRKRARTEVQKRDKFGQPLNHGPYQNGYHVGASKQAAQGLTVQADNVAELGALLGRLEANESKAGGSGKAGASGGAGGSSSAAGAGGSRSSSAAGRSAAGEERRHDVDGEL